MERRLATDIHVACMTRPLGSNRVVEYGPFPRSGWGRCANCGRGSQLLFYWNEHYSHDREAGRAALSETLCRRCIDQREAPRSE
jgi:hypothetical protein